jgi:L-iditol 2-dehydrogenase
MVLRLPDHVSLDQGAMVEPVSVAVHALRRFGSIQGMNVLVLGAGTIGSLVGQCANAMGAANVMITDVSDYKTDFARKCGFQHVVNPKTADLNQAILSVMGDRKADVIFECVGVQDTITTAINVARKGSSIVVVGVFGQKPIVDLGLVQDRELSLIGTLMYQRQDYERAIELVSSGKLHLDPMITHRFDFRHYLDAYEAIETSGGQYMKVMIDL